MSRPIIRDATMTDLMRFYGKLPAESVRAVAIVLDGEPIAIGGIAYRRRQLTLFSDVKPEAAEFPVTLIRAAKRLLATLGKAPAVAIAQDDVEGSPARLEKLGFLRTGIKAERGEVMLWRS